MRYLVIPRFHDPDRSNFSNIFYKIGVPNIRAYEEKELHKQQENSKRRLEFENQHSRLTNLLEYEQVIRTFFIHLL